MTAVRPMASPNRAYTLVQPLKQRVVSEFIPSASPPHPVVKTDDAVEHSSIVHKTIWKDLWVLDIKFNVLDFGARGDGTTVDDKPIQKAMDACAATKGGGIVVFERGRTFRIRSLTLPARDVDSTEAMELRIEAGATLLVDDNRSAYPAKSHVFQGVNVTNTVFSGGGTIDGQGQNWWLNFHEYRPHIMDFGERFSTRSQHILVENITVRNCPSHCLEIKANWTEVRHVHIENPPNGYPSAAAPQSYNTDGVDMMGDPFYVHHCNITTGDDNVAIHFNNTLVENNYFGTGHGASIGSLATGSMGPGPGKTESAYLTNITVRNCVFNRTQLGVRIKVDPGAAQGRVWNVRYENLTMVDVQTAIQISEYYFDPTSKPTLLQIEDLVISGVHAYRTAGEYAADLRCQPSIPCRNVSLQNLQFHNSAGNGFLCENVNGRAQNVYPMDGLTNTTCNWGTLRYNNMYANRETSRSKLDDEQAATSVRQLKMEGISTDNMPMQPPWRSSRGVSRFDAHGRFSMTVNEPDNNQFFSCHTPLWVPNQPYTNDSQFNICGTYDNPDNDRPTKPGTGYNATNMLTATAFAAGDNLDVNAIVGVVVARKDNTGGAGMGAMGHAAARMAVAHGIEIESDCHSPGTNCDEARSALFLAGGGSGGLAIQSFQEWRSSAAVNSPRQGILLGSGVPFNPFQSAGGAIMGSAGKHVQADFGIDLRLMVANKAAFASEGFAVDGAGKVTSDAFRCAGSSAKELCAAADGQAATIAAQDARICSLESAYAVARLESVIANTQLKSDDTATISCEPAAAIASKQSLVVVAERVLATNGSCTIVTRVSSDGGTSFSGEVRRYGTVGSGLVLLTERESGDFLLFSSDIAGRVLLSRSPQGSQWFEPSELRFVSESQWQPSAGACQLSSGGLVLGGVVRSRGAVAISDDFATTWRVVLLPDKTTSVVGCVNLPAGGVNGSDPIAQPCAGQVCPSSRRIAIATEDGSWFELLGDGQLQPIRSVGHGRISAVSRWGSSVVIVSETDVLMSVDPGLKFNLSVSNRSVPTHAAITIVPEVIGTCPATGSTNNTAGGCGYDAHRIRPLIAAPGAGAAEVSSLDALPTSCYASCSGNGHCINETCLCSHGWKAPACATRVATASQQPDPSTLVFRTANSTGNVTTVLAGNARFQLLTSSLLRLEWSPTKGFTDAPSVSITRRAWPAVVHRVIASGTVVITTSEMRIEYNASSSEPFSADNLRVMSKDATWQPNTIDAQNLGGFPRYPHDLSSYDTLTHGLTNGSGMDGFLSRGFVYLDDSTSPEHDASVDWIRPRPSTVTPRSVSACAAVAPQDRAECAPELGLGRGDSTWLNCSSQDAHCAASPAFDHGAAMAQFKSVCEAKSCCFDNSSLPMCFHASQYRDGFLIVNHDNNHKSVLTMLSSLLGPPPMPPRHALGTWIGDRAAYSAEEWFSFVARYRELGLPFDMLTVDSDSSTKATWIRGSWDSEMLPDPSGFWKTLSDEFGVTTTVNEHFSAISRESAHQFEAIRQTMGLPTDTATIEHTLANSTYARVFWDELHRRDLQEGMAFWWQDGNAFATNPYTGQLPGLNPMLWTRHVIFAQHSAQADAGLAMRPWVYCRPGGIGDHRSGTIFTGDIGESWTVMRSTVIVSMRSGNALAPYLASNDMGMDSGVQGFDGTLFVRWVQASAMLAHQWLHPAWGTRFPFDFGQRGIKTFRDYVGLRYALMPYIYSYARVAHEDGHPLVRPMYLEYPHDEESYVPCAESEVTNTDGTNQCQFMLGEWLLVAPVTDPVPTDGSPNLKTIWLPESGSEWYDFFTPTNVRRGDQTFNFSASLEQLPLLIKAGAILPMAPPMMSTSERPVDPLIIAVFAGSSSSNFSLYEDDGNSTEYKTKQAYTWTDITFTPAAGKLPARLSIAPVRGNRHRGSVPSRRYELRIFGLPRPEAVSVASAAPNATVAESTTYGGIFGDGWRWDATTQTTTVQLLTPRNTSQALQVAFHGAAMPRASVIRAARTCRDAVREVQLHVRLLWATLGGGNDISKPPRLLRTLDQIERELTASVAPRGSFGRELDLASIASNAVRVAGLPNAWESARNLPAVKEQGPLLATTGTLWKATSPGLAAAVEKILARGCVGVADGVLIRAGLSI
jgi:polygalacturonase